MSSASGAVDWKFRGEVVAGDARGEFVLAQYGDVRLAVQGIDGIDAFAPDHAHEREARLRTGLPEERRTVP